MQILQFFSSSANPIALYTFSSHTALNPSTLQNSKESSWVIIHRLAHLAPSYKVVRVQKHCACHRGFHSNLNTSRMVEWPHLIKKARFYPAIFCGNGQQNFSKLLHLIQGKTGAAENYCCFAIARIILVRWNQVPEALHWPVKRWT